MMSRRHLNTSCSINIWFFVIHDYFNRRKKDRLITGGPWALAKPMCAQRLIFFNVLLIDLIKPIQDPNLQCLPFFLKFCFKQTLFSSINVYLYIPDICYIWFSCSSTWNRIKSKVVQVIILEWYFWP